MIKFAALMILLPWMIAITSAVVTTRQSSPIPTTIPRPTTILPPNQERSNIIIRQTIESDVEEVSNMLADESTRSQAPEKGLSWNNWALNMQRLKAKASFQSQLSHRLRATQAARKILASNTLCHHSTTPHSHDHTFHVDCNTSVQKCDSLWSNDNFVSKLEKAVQITNSYDESFSLWDNHNFALRPTNPDILNHIMMTATTQSGQVVGFCEIAMMPTPNQSLYEMEHDGIQSESSSTQFAPCIANLITSPTFRRNGIASRMIHSAIRFSKIHWAFMSGTISDDMEYSSVGCPKLSLYVDSWNERALSLYQKEGFVMKGQCEHIDGRMFLESTS